MLRPWGTKGLTSRRDNKIYSNADASVTLRLMFAAALGKLKANSHLLSN